MSNGAAKTVELPEITKTVVSTLGASFRVEEGTSAIDVKQEAEEYPSDMIVSNRIQNHQEKTIPYPLFKKPIEYMNFRKGGFFRGHFKRWSERRAIDRCLSGLSDIRTVCDCPCGPGRLFPYWKRKSLRIIGVDLSDPMVDAAVGKQNELGIYGSILKGDAFNLKPYLKEKPDLVASVRFCYYFDGGNRIDLLQSLASASRRYILVQYKTSQTRKGKRNLARIKSGKRSHPSSKKYCSHQDIINEVLEAGLICQRIESVSEASDFVFVLAEKPNNTTGFIQQNQRAEAVE